VSVAPSTEGFSVQLENFDGPFDLLLNLIAQREMDITEVALAEVTDEYIARVMSEGSSWDLSGASEFVVVAATLLDLKAARLLPQGDVEDYEDIEAWEARDLLFARLLQYRAFKDVAGTFADLWEAPARRGRSVPLEPQFATLLPDLVWNVQAPELAQIAAEALTSSRTTDVNVGHLHHPRVSVAEEATVLSRRLRRESSVSFRSLVSDADHVAVVVARFLALLELFRESLVAFDQVASLGELRVRWTGGEAQVDVNSDFDAGHRDE